MAANQFVNVKLTEVPVGHVGEHFPEHIPGQLGARLLGDEQRSVESLFLRP
jgi:hypothetical protein